MIELLTGKVVHRAVDRIILDVNGVGYGVEMPSPDLLRLEVGDETQVHVHTHVREDALKLYGFADARRKELFVLLLGLSGVGPKHALAILSAFDVDQLTSAVLSEDARSLETVHGIGARQSKKIILELKPKLEKLGPSPTIFAKAGATTRDTAIRLTDATIADLKSALLNLGYKDKELAPVLKSLTLNPPSTDLTALIRAALAELGGGPRPRAEALEEVF